jgi:DnaJ family protein C protein 7
MPLPNIFQKTKKKTTDPDDAPPDTQSSPRTASRSPEKKSSSSSSKTPGEKDRHRRTDSKQHSRRPKQSSPTKSSSRTNSHKYDPDLHPLNLPPEELRRLSAMSVAGEQYPQPPDVDREFTASPTPSSPLVPGAFPQTSGTKVSGNSEGSSEAAPRPPPHRTPTSPPPAQNPTKAPAPPPADAEVFKTNGNKFFKAKDYPSAIREYTKGIINHT